MKNSFRLFRIAGIVIEFHYTWIFIFLLIAWSLAQGFFPQQYPGWNAISYWVTGVMAALFLFVSVLLHELAHSLVAKAKGMSVSSITLFIFGGVSNLKEEPEKPKTEFIMAIVGPLSSLILAGIFWGLTQTISNQGSPVAAVLSYLALINLLLAVFNLIPGFPLDGGRVLRSILWGTTGNLGKATSIAATVGMVFGWGLILFGLFQLLSGNFLGGLWIAFIGWFLSSAADASRKEITLREYLSGIKIREVMNPSLESVSPDISLETVVWDIFRRHHGRAVPVCHNSELVGIVTITDVKELSRDKWAETTVGQIMTRKPLYTVSPDDSLQVAMELIAHHDINQVLITNHGQCAGLISRADIIGFLQFNQELGVEKSSRKIRLKNERIQARDELKRDHQQG